MIDTSWIMLSLILVILIWSLHCHQRPYDQFIHGVKEGMGLFLTLFPNMLAMMFAVKLLESSGLAEALSRPFTLLFPSVPSCIVPLIFFRPVSGSASLALVSMILQNSGPDSLAGMMASAIQGSTDTTFYVITLYFSSVGIRKIGNSLPVGLFADMAGILTAILLTLLFCQ